MQFFEGRVHVMLHGLFRLGCLCTFPLQRWPRSLQSLLYNLKELIL